MGDPARRIAYLRKMGEIYTLRFLMGLGGYCERATRRTLVLHTPYGRVSVQDSRLFFTRGLRAAGGTRKKRHRACGISEDFVA